MIQQIHIQLEDGRRIVAEVPEFAPSCIMRTVSVRLTAPFEDAEPAVCAVKGLRVHAAKVDSAKTARRYVATLRMLADAFDEDAAEFDVAAKVGK